MRAAKTPPAWPYCDGQCDLDEQACNDPMLCARGLTELELDEHNRERNRQPEALSCVPAPWPSSSWALPRRARNRLIGALVGAVVVCLVMLLSGCGGGDDDTPDTGNLPPPTTLCGDNRELCK